MKASMSVPRTGVVEQVVQLVLDLDKTRWALVPALSSEREPDLPAGRAPRRFVCTRPGGDESVPLFG